MCQHFHQQKYYCFRLENITVEKYTVQYFLSWNSRNTSLKKVPAQAQQHMRHTFFNLQKKKLTNNCQFSSNNTMFPDPTKGINIGITARTITVNCFTIINYGVNTLLLNKKTCYDGNRGRVIARAEICCNSRRFNCNKKAIYAFRS